MSITESYDWLYQNLERDGRILKLNCKTSNENVDLEQILCCKQSYVCCLTHPTLGCLLHQCIIVFLGTSLDKKFRLENTKILPKCFIIDGHMQTFSHIMMNNNVQIHIFCDKTTKQLVKRLFLYGNFAPQADNEKIDFKKFGQGIQLIYNQKTGILIARDVYGTDYVDENEINKGLRKYLSDNFKWPMMHFLFPSDGNFVLMFKNLMKSFQAEYSIDDLSNKLIYTHAQLLYMLYMFKLQEIDYISKNVKNFKYKTRNADSKKIFDIIRDGKLTKCVSKTQVICEKFRMNKVLQQHNSKMNVNIKLFPLKYKHSCEIARIVATNVNYTALKHSFDYKFYIDSFFHGEMTAAGKRFLLCKNVHVLNIDYEKLCGILKFLIRSNLLTTNNELPHLQLIFNSCPTKYYVTNVIAVVVALKNLRLCVELKINKNYLFLNSYHGMVMRLVQCEINAVTHTFYLTPYEYHNHDSIFKQFIVPFLDKRDLCSSVFLHYTKYYTSSIINVIPSAKLFVAATNLKNGCVVFRRHKFNMLRHNNFKLGEILKYAPAGDENYVVTSTDAVYKNSRYVYLWTMLGDVRLSTSEDPYIPNIHLPFEIWSTKIVTLQGRCHNTVRDIKIFDHGPSNFIDMNNGILLINLCSIVSNTEIMWKMLGKKIKMHYTKSGVMHIYKLNICVHSLIISSTLQHFVKAFIDKNNVYVNVGLEFQNVANTHNKICSIHGQKGVLNNPIDMTNWLSSDNLHPDVMLSPISYMYRQTVFDPIFYKAFEKRDIVIKNDNGVQLKSVMFKIPYVVYHAHSNSLATEYRLQSSFGIEKTEGTRLDMYTIDNAFVGNLISKHLQHLRNINCDIIDLPQNYKILKSLTRTQNINIVDDYSKEQRACKRKRKQSNNIELPVTTTKKSKL